MKVIMTSYLLMMSLKNVKAVKEVLDIADVKGKVYQARMKASKGLSDQIK